MRIFPEAWERGLHELESVRAWARSGLIRPEQLQGIESALSPLPAVAGHPIRTLFFGLSAVAQAALCLFVSSSLDIRSSDVVGRVLIALSIPCYFLGELLIKRFGLYRFGVEEGLLAGAAVQLCLGIFMVVTEGLHLPSRDSHLIISSSAAAASLWLLARFGYLYAGFAFIFSLGGLVFSFDIAENSSRLALAALYGALLGASVLWREVPDHERDKRDILQASLFMGVYLVLNLRLESLAEWAATPRPPGSGVFYWTTLLLVWIIPAAGFHWGIRARRRAVIAAAGIAALITIMTWKPYLGIERNAWDPAVLGAALMGLAVWLIRRLDSGPGGTRSGFTARRLIVAREDGLGASAILAAAAAAGALGPAAPQGKPRFEGGGGKSGGAGAGGGF